MDNAGQAHSMNQMDRETSKVERGAVADPRPASPKPRQLPPWNVVLLDDDDHSYDYVVRMMQTVFSATPERAYRIACEVDSTGRAVCATLHKELAELRQAQVHSFGADPLIASCRGGMSAVIEPAGGGSDDSTGDPPNGAPP